MADVMTAGAPVRENPEGVAGATYRRVMGRGGRPEGSAAAAPTATRSAAEYRRLWREKYDERLGLGCPEGGARYSADEYLARVQAMDAGGRRPGSGDYDAYF